MAGAVIKSLLRETIEKLPKDYSRKTAKGAVDDLLKKGVKPEELKYADMKLPTGKVAKKDLTKAEVGRQDWFETVEPTPQYSSVTPGRVGENNPTYREKVLTFGRQDGEELVPNMSTQEAHEKLSTMINNEGDSPELQSLARDYGWTGNNSIDEFLYDGNLTIPQGGGSRYTSAHFGTKNYLMHTRVHDATFNGTKTRVLNEIQSDLHQAGRQQGYSGGEITPNKLTDSQLDVLDKYTQGEESVMDEAIDMLADLGVADDDIPDAALALASGQNWTSSGVPESPLEKNWLRKGIERELVDATKEGRQQLAIPINKATGQQKLSPKQRKIVQTLIDGERLEDVDLIDDEAWDILKANGFDMEAHSPGEFADALLTSETGSGSKLITELSRSEGVQKWYETQVVNTAKKVAKQTGGTFEMQDIDGISYAVIKPNAAKGVNVNLYSSTLGAAYVTYEALQAGMPAEEINNRLIATKSYDQEDLEEIRKQVEVIAQATAAGYSMEEIKAEMEGREITADTTASVPLPIASDPYWAGIAKPGDVRKVTPYEDEQLASAPQNDPRNIGLAQPGDEAIITPASPESIAALKHPYEVGVPEFWQPMVKMARFADSPKRDKYELLVDNTRFMSAEELVSSLNVLHPTMTSDLMTTIPAYFGNKDAAQRYDAAREASRNRIVQIAKDDYGLELLWQPGGVTSEGWYAQTEQGLVEVTPGFWEDFRKNTLEIGGGFAGAAAGAKAGGRLAAGAAIALGQAGPQAGLPEELATVPFATWSGRIVGAALGSWMGSSVGAGYDYLYQAAKMQEDIEAEAMAYRSLNALETAAVGEAVGYPIAKGLGITWKGIVGAKNFVFKGNPKGAYKAVKELAFLDDSQVAEIVTNLEKYAPLEGSQYEKGIQAVSLTQPGMQDVVDVASSIHPSAASATSASVSKRASDVLTQTAALTDEQVPRMLTQDLLSYTTDVRQAYSEVKAAATQSPKGLNFGWDFKKLAVQPVMDSLSVKITNPAAKEQFLLQMSRVNAMSESRSFGDLIELRQMVNDFLFNKKIVKADDRATLRTVLGNIDSAIEEGASSVVEDPKQWLGDWAKVRKDYSEMKRVEKSTFYKSIFDKNGQVRGLKPEEVVKRLGKYITALDGSFEEVMTKIPIKGRKLYEGAVVDQLTKRYTHGEKGIQAIHFPGLAEDLRKVNFTTPDARAAKKAILDLSEVFKNDVALAQFTGQINIPKFQSFLTADPVVRLKFEAATGIFNLAKSRMPGEKNRQLALVRSAAKLLSKPLDVKNFKELQKEVFGDANLSRQILELQQEAARDVAKGVKGAPLIKVYKGGKLKGTGASTSIPMHRIVTLKQAQEIAEREALTLDSKSLDAVLKQYGYKAILQGSDRVRILGEK